MIETKFDIVDQLNGLSCSSLTVCYNIGIIALLSKRIDYPVHPRSQLVWIISILL